MGNKNVVGAVLALLALAGLLLFAAALLFLKIPEDNQQLVNIALMAIVGNVGTAFGFFLGASVSGTKAAPAPPSPGTAPAPEPPSAPAVSGS